ncbi:MAG: hypothetical protein FJ149_07560 [Euryarchaeota archaeon]|nr:hypothetical protein [Euryarchaeota archaeon]
MATSWISAIVAPPRAGPGIRPGIGAGGRGAPGGAGAAGLGGGAPGTGIGLGAPGAGPGAGAGPCAVAGFWPCGFIIFLTSYLFLPSAIP